MWGASDNGEGAGSLDAQSVFPAKKEAELTSDAALQTGVEGPSGIF